MLVKVPFATRCNVAAEVPNLPGAARAAAIPAWQSPARFLTNGERHWVTGTELVLAAGSGRADPGASWTRD